MLSTASTASVMGPWRCYVTAWSSLYSVCSL